MKAQHPIIKAFKDQPLVILAVLLVLVGGFYLATLRDGHNWGGDFSLYIQHALNIINGRPYAESGYIYNPLFSNLSPQSYPPGYPLYLVPVIAAFGVNLTAMKVQTVLTFIAALAVIYALFKTEAGNKYVLPTVAFLGFSPFFWYFKDEVRSDILFLFLVMLCLYLLRKADDAYAQDKPSSGYAFLAGLLMYLSIATRTVGIVFVPTLLFTDLLHYRKLPTKTLIMLAMVVVLFAIQSLILPSGGGYFDILSLNFLGIALNLREYWKAFAGFLVSYRGGAVGLVIGYALSFVAGVEYYARIRQRLTYQRVFLLLYVGVLLIWPAFQHTRFLIPILPFAVLYVLNGVHHLGALVLKYSKRVRIAVGLVLCLLAIFAIINYSQANYQRVIGGIGESTTQEFFDFIRENTNQDDVIVFFKPRVLSLYTGRASSIFHKAEDAELWAYFDTIDAAYLTTGPEDRLYPYWRPFIERSDDKLNKVFSNSDLAVYEIVR